jgi:hypothetical protein
VGLIAAGALLHFRRRQSHGTCANCGSSSNFGYSNEAESKAEDIVKLCFTCLSAKLTDDYKQFSGKALVIQPAAGFPCYVFQPKSRWADSKLVKEMSEMFSGMEETCNQCTSNAHFLWATSNGLVPSNFDKVLSEGLTETLSLWGNPRPVSLCTECCVRQITKAIDDHRLSYYEVCGPRSEDGFVIPMGY